MRHRPPTGTGTGLRVAILILLAGVILLLTGCGTAVPETRGMSAEQATWAIESAGFRVGKVTYDDKAIGAVGAVVAQQPEAGKQAKRDTLVFLTVAGAAPGPTPELSGLDKDKAAAVVISKGLPLVGVPSVKGKTQADATKSLEAAGFRVKVEQKADTAKKGLVIAQKPSSGQAQAGATVLVTVSTGAPMKPSSVRANTPVTLQGTVEEKSFISAKTEEPIKTWVLVLDAPVDVPEDGGYGPEIGVQTMQINYPDGYETLGGFDGQRVSATGSLFFADNWNHLTPVLITVDRLVRR